MQDKLEILFQDNQGSWHNSDYTIKLTSKINEEEAIEELKSKWYVSCKNKEDKNNYKHPTIKPLELVKKHLLHSSNENDTVLDCFMGSGTTGVACKELNRNFIGIEIDDEYFKIAKDRINGITASGQLSIFTDTEKMEQGSLFDEV